MGSRTEKWCDLCGGKPNGNKISQAETYMVPLGDGARGMKSVDVCGVCEEPFLETEGT